MNNITKIDAARLCQEFGLEGLPAKVYHHGARPDRDTLAQDFTDSGIFMLRSGSANEERNLPRRAGASLSEAEVWIRELPPHLDVVVQPYAPVVFSVELAWYGERYVAELVPGIWELSTAISPLVLTVRGEETTLSGSLSPQPVMYHTFKRGYYRKLARVEDWQIQTLITWIQSKHDKLSSLQSHLGGGAFGVKMHLALGFGLSPQNIRTKVPSLDLDISASQSTELVRIVTVDDAIPSETDVFLDVSIAREEHAALSGLIGRLLAASTRVVYLKSGLLSHLAIALREAGLTVRRIDATVLRT